MTFVALYDANVLYPSTLRDVLIRIALGDLVQTKWTDAILDETFRSIEKNRPDRDPRKLERTRQLLRTVVRDSPVTDYEDLIPIVTLEHDPDDRHVVAAAIKSGAQVIVRFNLKDLPPTNSRSGPLKQSIPMTSSLTSSTSTAPQCTGHTRDRGFLDKPARYRTRRTQQPRTRRPPADHSTPAPITAFPKTKVIENDSNRESEAPIPASEICGFRIQMAVFLRK